MSYKSTSEHLFNLADEKLQKGIFLLKKRYDLSNDDILRLIGNLLMNYNWTVEDELMNHDWTVEDEEK